MKLTLLEIVQDVLNEMDSDAVNSITDTVEAGQVAAIAKACYLEIMANRNWPHMHTAFTCESLADTDFPSCLTLPSNIKELKWIKYNKRTLTDTRDKYDKVSFMEPESFYEHLCSRDSSASNVVVVSINDVSLNIQTDKAPTYWTTFDDTTIVMDSYDSEVDDVLQTTKNACWGVKNPVWTHTDDAVPDLPAEAFPGYVEEVKSTAFVALKQVVNMKAEQKATRQARWLSRKSWRSKGGIRYPDYGRKRNVSQRNPMLSKD